MEDLYSEIREQSKQDYGQKFEEWAPRILVDQYSDRTHFIFELIQNAEDAGATYVTFSLYPDRLVLCHNGKPFSEADIRGICGIRSTKDDPDSGKNRSIRHRIQVGLCLYENAPDLFWKIFFPDLQFDSSLCRK